VHAPKEVRDLTDMIRKALGSERGLSLVELMVALALIVVVLGPVYQYFHYGYSGWNRASAEARVIQDARLLLIQVSEEVRTARVAIDGGTALEVQSATELNVYTDVAGDEKPEKVCYRLNGTVLERAVVEPEGDAFPYTYGNPVDWETVLRRVNNTEIFSTPDLDGDPVTPNSREAVHVELSVDDLDTPLTEPLSVRATLTVRSRGEAE